MDSGFAPAWAWLGKMYAIQTFGPKLNRTLVAKARSAVRKGLALDPNLSDAYVSLAIIRQLFDWDWRGAEDALRRALELDPNNWDGHYEYGLLLKRLARYDEALSELRRGLALDPFSPTAYDGLMNVYIVARRYDEAIETTRTALLLFPNSAVIQGSAAVSLRYAGKEKEAEEPFKKYFALCCGLSEAQYNDLPETRLRRLVASGDRNRALAVVREMERSYPTTRDAYFFAVTYAEIGEKGEALRWAERGVEMRESALVINLKTHPSLDPLRGDPRFQALLTKVGLQ
jgi:tetratricopeptide (TPR) repeat protein